MTAPTTKPSRAAYRRRRAVSAVVAGLFVLAGARAADAVVTGAGAGHVAPHAKVVHYQVRPGDTLWSIAGRLAPHADPREVVDLLVQAHGGATLQPGDVLDWAGT